MKPFTEYLAESKKIYNFKVKVAGELPEAFQENLKTALDRCKCIML
jgi:ABC-type phosphate/phosphonate transport system substrate-binding protein